MVWDSARIKILAVLLTLLLISVIIVLALLRPTVVFEPPFLITALNLLFLTILPFTIAYLAMRSYTASGVPSILLLGAGLIAFGCGSLVAGFTIYLPGGTNLTPTIHNSGALLGSLLITLSAIFAGFKIMPAKASARAKLYVALVYAGTFVAMATLSIIAIAGLVPTFFAQGVGPTMLRQVVLGTAVVLFTVSSVIYLRLYQTVRTYYVFWCGMGFVLIAVGLVAVFLQAGVGSLIGWAGRMAQYLGCLYLFIGRGAVVVIAGEKHITIAEEVANLHKGAANYEALVEIATDAIISIDEKGNILTWNAAASTIFGYQKYETVGQSFTRIIGPFPVKDYLDTEISKRKRPGKGPIEIRSGEFTARRKNGDPFPAEISAAGSSHPGSRIYTLIIKDITDRKLAEEALRESEEKHRAVTEKASDVIIIIQDGIIRFANPRVATMFGYETGEVVGMEFASFIAPENLGLALERYRKRMADEKLSEIYETELLHKSGRKIPVESSGSVIQYKGRQADLAIIRDITERKKAEKEVRASQQLLNKVMSSLLDPLFIIDANTVEIVDCNPAASVIFGYTREEMVGKTTTFLHVDQSTLDEFRQNLNSAVEEKGFLFLPDYLMRRKDASIFPTEHSVMPILDEKGKRAGWVSMIRDITDRKQAEESLKESEEKYRLVVENAREAIFVDAGSMFKFANRQATILTGYSQEELTSRPYAEFIHPDDRQLVAERGDRRITGLEEPGPYTFRAIVKSGDTRWVELSAVPITWEGKPAVLSFLTDVTDRKRLEEEQRRVEKLESVGLLAGGIAHDFNNILTSILGNISLASMEAAPGSELQNSLEQAEKASQRAKALTMQLLTFSKGGAPVLKLASLTELLKDTAGFALSGSKVKCNFSIPSDLWHAEIDAGQVSQVIHNLVINAQQAMPAGGSIEVTAENITLSKMHSLGKGLPLKEGNYIRIAVADNGSGISKEHLEKIFDPFFTTKKTGSGLGLATSFSIARNHGGHLSVESEVGSGSTFYLYLPASVQTSVPKEDKKEAGKPAGKARILVMDDEQGIREIAGRMLSNIGYKDIEFAEDGAEAIKMYKTAMKAGNPFSVAILDLTIAGGLGGEETIRKLLKIDPGVKAIVSSGYADATAMAVYKEFGFSGMVAKPYTLAELRKALQDVIG